MHKGEERTRNGPSLPEPKKGGTPLYHQVMRVLQEQILSGRLRPGQQLPSEAQLERRFHVSRVVVRQALRILDEQGLITRVRGKGTFVAEGIAHATPRISGSLQDLIHWGPDVSIRVVELRPVRATRKLADIFGLDEGDDLFHVQRVQLAQGAPYAVLDNYLPYHIGSRISLSDLMGTSLIVLIETLAGCPIEWASQVFETATADERVAELFEIDLLTPLLMLTLTVYARDGSVVNYAEVYYRSDRYRHHGFLMRSRNDNTTFWDGGSPVPEGVLEHAQQGTS